jgi:hypothetical protein
MSNVMAVASKPLIVSREAAGPWLAASLLVIVAFALGALGANGTNAQRAVLTIGLCGIVTATGLIMHRSNEVAEEARRAHRARPAADELIPWATDTLLTSHGDTTLPPYAAGMLRYTAAVEELFEHAIAVALDQGNDTTDLAVARDDAAALHHLLAGMAAEPVELRKAAKVHTICSLWEASQEADELAAAELDPDYYRRWRARHIATARLRHGVRPRREEQALPYQHAGSTS